MSHVRKNALRLFQELHPRRISSGVSTLDVDMVEASAIRAKDRLADEIAHFRDRLDELKAAVGLTPRAPVIPDPDEIVAFREAFEGVQNWHRNPKRTLDVFHQLVGRIPGLGEVKIDGTADPGRDRGEQT